MMNREEKIKLLHELQESFTNLLIELGDDYIHECKVCGEAFDNGEDLYEHYDENHNKPEE